MSRLPAPVRKPIDVTWLRAAESDHMTDTTVTRMQSLGYRKPDDVAEPEQLALVEYVSGGRVAIITSTGRTPTTRSRPNWQRSSSRYLRLSRPGPLCAAPS